MMGFLAVMHRGEQTWRCWATVMQGVGTTATAAQEDAEAAVGGEASRGRAREGVLGAQPPGAGAVQGHGKRTG